MASKNTVISTLLGYVTGSYSDWYAGITDDPNRRKKEHGNPSRFRSIQADSEKVARDAEAALINKGLQGGMGGGINPTYVYVYKI